MKFEEIKQKSNLKVLFRAQSARGKTYSCSKIALEVSKRGGKVLYIDTEAEGSTTIVHLVESGGYSEDDVENIEYRQVESYESLTRAISRENQENYDLVIVDTLDHKHTFTIDKVMEDVVDNESQAMSPDWNMYPEIYSREKRVMEVIGKPRTNIIATLDPESGKMDKPKGTQTNIHGYFTVVIDIKEGGEDRVYLVRNWLGKDDWIGNSNPKFKEIIIKEIMERTEHVESTA